MGHYLQYTLHCLHTHNYRLYNSHVQIFLLHDIVFRLCSTHLLYLKLVCKNVLGQSILEAMKQSILLILCAFTYSM